MSANTFDTAAVKTWLLDLQAHIVAALETADGLPFRTDAWQRPEGGGGIDVVTPPATSQTSAQSFFPARRKV